MAELNADDDLRCELVDDPEVGAVLRVAGDVDITTSEVLAAAIAETLRRRTGGPLVLDLAGVTFLDSSGLTVLIGVVQRGERLVLRDPSDVVRRVVEASGLAGVMPVER